MVVDGLNSELCACKADIVPLEPCLQFSLLSIRRLTSNFQCMLAIHHSSLSKVKQNCLEIIIFQNQANTEVNFHSSRCIIPLITH
jgi:hypothetical protein